MRYVAGLLAILCLAAVAAAAEPEPLRCTVRPLGNEMTLGVPFGLEVTLENTSDKALAIPDPWATQTQKYGWYWVRAEWWSTADNRPVNPDNWAIVQSPGAADKSAGPAVKDVRVLAPGSSLKFTVWILWDAINGTYEKPRRMVAGGFLRGGVHMRVRYTMPDSFPKDHAPDFTVKPWTGSIESPNIAVDIVRAEPAVVVAQVIEGTRELKTAEDRYLAREALAVMTCRHFGKGPGLTDEDLAEAQKWLEANRGKDRQQWIAVALASKDAADRKEAAANTMFVKDPALAAALDAALDPSEPEVALEIIRALWTNYPEKRGLDCGGKLLRNGPWPQRETIMTLAVRNEVRPLMDEACETLPGFIKAEKDPKTLGEMVWAAYNLRIKQAIPVLEELDARQPTPSPVHLIPALAYLKGKDYEPRLIEHLLKNPDPGARSQAARCMGYHGLGCIDALITALRDEDADVRSAACGTLYRLGPDCTPQQKFKAAEILIDLLDKDNLVQGYHIRHTLVSLKIGKDPGEVGRTRHDLAEAWRAVLREAREKK